MAEGAYPPLTFCVSFSNVQLKLLPSTGGMLWLQENVALLVCVHLALQVLSLLLWFVEEWEGEGETNTWGKWAVHYVYTVEFLDPALVRF